jgi:hypothetical protein
MQVVVRQVSGLGNQLFQYAAGVYYAKQLGADVRVAVHPPQASFSFGYARPFLLPQFTIPVPLQPLGIEDRLVLTDKPQFQAAAKAWRAAKRIRVALETVAQRYHFQPDLGVAGARTVYLVGYWQAWRITQAIAPELRDHLRFRQPAEGRNREVLETIRGTQTPVSLHIRRGDYTLAAEGSIALSLDYYRKAIEKVRVRYPDAKFFVFSDDIAWSREHLPADLPAVFVDHNDDMTSHEDLRLMSACSHHIIANSSFSWWGAWLNPAPTKMVIAPKHWLLTPESYFPDLLPPDWTVLDSARKPQAGG